MGDNRATSGGLEARWRTVYVGEAALAAIGLDLADHPPTGAVLIGEEGDPSGGAHTTKAASHAAGSEAPVKRSQYPR